MFVYGVMHTTVHGYTSTTSPKRLDSCQTCDSILTRAGALSLRHAIKLRAPERGPCGRPRGSHALSKKYRGLTDFFGMVVLRTPFCGRLRQVSLNGPVRLCVRRRRPRHPKSGASPPPAAALCPSRLARFGPSASRVPCEDREALSRRAGVQTGPTIKKGGGSRAI
eukprot:scaffold897_cov402-Prasinococcus_capsulatus_cf.AAC.2